MSAESTKALAKLVGEPEIVPFLDGQGKYTLMEVEECLHGLVALQGHPSTACRSRVRAALMNDIWARIYVHESANRLRWLVLRRIEFRARVRGLHDLRQELWILANLWDAGNSREDLDAECEAVEDWDYQFLGETYLSPTPSPDAVADTAGRAIYYVANGNMSGTAPASETAKYFGWEIW